MLIVLYITATFYAMYFGALVFEHYYTGFYANLMSGVKACVYVCKHKDKVMYLELATQKWWVGLSMHKVH